MSERITIKSPSQLEKMRVAGRLVGETLNYLETLVEVGISTYELDKEAEAFIRKHGGVPSFLNYSGYPASICTSINEVVVHGIPSKKRKLRDGDIISIDCGAIVDGWHGDAARTFLVGDVDPEVRKLVEVTKECFFLGAEQAVEGNHLIDIARAVETHAKEYGYGVIRDMVGHGIGTSMHEPPEVPNYVDPRMGKGAKLYEGMTLAIEPMISLGTWRIVIARDGWTCSTQDGSPAAHYENTLIVGKNSSELLTLV
ncbi:MAG: type I methionyl aminopeptidase [Clostridia bacterium]|jgi:methionyl aminopeptidase|nr:type I methionyl aminopeptidase [Clostridia bacterium]MBQ5488219.1 type I methionyl aminopeptidase [Clostridia bacterium]